MSAASGPQDEDCSFTSPFVPVATYLGNCLQPKINKVTTWSKSAQSPRLSPFILQTLSQGEMCPEKRAAHAPPLCLFIKGKTASFHCSEYKLLKCKVTLAKFWVSTYIYAREHPTQMFRFALALENLKPNSRMQHAFEIFLPAFFDW